MQEILTVTATEANRNFAQLMRKVKAGARVEITSHGEAFAEILPKHQFNEEEHARRRAALAKLEAHWATITPSTIGPWTREELYERD
jgi:prevent-host-death family protein